MAFLSAFVSYLLLMAIIVVVGGAAIFAGITLRKRNDAKKLSEAGSADAKEAAAGDGAN